MVTPAVLAVDAMMDLLFNERTASPDRKEAAIDRHRRDPQVHPQPLEVVEDVAGGRQLHGSSMLLCRLDVADAIHRLGH